MPEHKKRIVVEGVDFQQLFLFPKMLRAVTLAMQPGRLVIGLLMVTALITFGRIWDGMTTPTVSPDGLAAGVWRADVHGPPYQKALRDGMVTFTGASAPAVGLGGPSSELQAETVLQRMKEEYTLRRASLTDEAERAKIDEDYTTAVRQIRALGPQGVFGAASEHFFERFKLMAGSVVALDAHGFINGLQGTVVGTPWYIWRDHAWFGIGFGLVVMVTFAIGGGAIARSVAVQLALQQRISVRESIDFSTQHWWAMFAAQLLPVVLIAIVCGVIMIMGVLMAAPVLDLIGAVLYGLALLLGLAIAFLIIGYLFGHCMLVPAVACENCSGPDAMQRAYAYVVTRPLHLLGYLVIALIGLAIGFLVVRTIAAITMTSTAALYGTLVTTPAMTADTGAETLNLARHVSTRELDSWHLRWAAGIVGFWETLIVCLVAAYVLAYFFSASTIGYLLMRRAADGQDIDEIWQPGMIPGTFMAQTEVTIATVSTAEQTNGGS